MTIFALDSEWIDVYTSTGCISLKGNVLWKKKYIDSWHKNGATIMQCYSCCFYWVDIEVKKIKCIGMAMKTRAVLRTAYHWDGICIIYVLAHHLHIFHMLGTSRWSSKCAINGMHYRMRTCFCSISLWRMNQKTVSTVIINISWSYLQLKYIFTQC